MITREQISKMADFHKVPAHIIEQDYVISLFLSRLYLLEQAENFVFKGGTCMRLVYKLNRFSEDMDFTFRGGILEEDKITSPLKTAASELSFTGVEAEITKEKKDPESFSCRLRYKGPLYDGTPLSAGSIRIEISTRGDLYIEPSWIPITFDYADVPTARAMCMQEQEIFAEKIRACLSRGKPRDFYDIWFLKNKGLKPDTELVKQKCAATNTPFKKPEKAPTKKQWAEDMRALLPGSMDPEPIFGEVMLFLESITNKKALKGAP